MVADSAVDVVYIVFSPFASVAVIVFVLPLLAVVEVASECIGADAVVVAVGGAIVAHILDIGVAGWKNRMTRREEFQLGTPASLAMVCAFDKIQREPIRW